MSGTPPSHVTVTSAAKMLGLSKTRIYYLIRKGKLDTVTAPGVRTQYISVESINRRKKERG